MYNNIVNEDCSEVKCAKVIHDMFDKLRGLSRARDGLRQFRYHYGYPSTILALTTTTELNHLVKPLI